MMARILFGFAVLIATTIPPIGLLVGLPFVVAASWLYDRGEARR